MKDIGTSPGPALRRLRRSFGRRILLIPAVAAALTSSAVAQRDDGEDNETRGCINLREIDRTRVPNEDTILFYLRGGDVYRNNLPNRCPNLDFDERFMYRVTGNQLCDTDVITVIDDLGFGFLPGATCGLGEFQPITEEEAENLVTQGGRDRARH
jgi:hypothetical protein